MGPLIKYPTVQQVSAYLDRIVNNLNEDEVTPNMLATNVSLLKEALDMLKGIYDTKQS